MKGTDPTTGPLNSGLSASSPISLAEKARNSENLHFTDQTSFSCRLSHPACHIKAEGVAAEKRKPASMKYYTLHISNGQK